MLLGPSGCGKTTTLRMIAGLEEADGGTIRFDDRVVVDGDAGRSVPAQKRGIGMVFQSYALWPHVTVRSNVEWPLKVKGWSAAERRHRSAEVLQMLDIGHLADRHPAQLSGGQQQRVAIARTVAPRPKVLLFDEPLSNLDARLRVDTRAELVAVHRATGATSIYVTHDQVEALAMATHIAVMKDGKLEQFGTVDELLERPRTAFVAQFLGSPASVLIDGEVTGGQLRFGEFVLAAGLPADDGERLTARYAPERLRLVEARPHTPGAVHGPQVEVMESTPSAGRHVVTVRLGRRRLSVVADARAVVGSVVQMLFPAEPDDLFDTTGMRAERTERGER